MNSRGHRFGKNRKVRSRETLREKHGKRFRPLEACQLALTNACFSRWSMGHTAHSDETVSIAGSRLATISPLRVGSRLS